MTHATKFPAPIAEQIWDLKYRLKAPDGTVIDHSLDDTLIRVAHAAAGAEKGGRKQERWAAKFHAIMSDFGFLPAGRILAGAGAGRSVTLSNCFVMGPVKDDLGGIFNAVKRGAKTMQSGGGIGIDFSTLRPKGALVKSIGADASGPVSFMSVWDAMCQTILSAGARRGAMMGTLRVDHPDVEAFIDAKNEAGQLTNFNLSVLVTDAFMEAVTAGKPWDLTFDGTVYATVRARDLWDKLMRATYDYAEPGVIFIDRVNAQNNLSYCETIHATNPCGEQPLPPFGACLLGSVNLTSMVAKPFSKDAHVELSKLEEHVRIAVRMLDNLIDVSRYPLKRQRAEAHAKRRMGIGMTGLADALIMCGLDYGSDEAAVEAGKWMATIQNAAYAASTELATEKGAFPAFDKHAFLQSPNVKRLPADLRADIARSKIRNGCLTSIAPTGTISLLAGNISSGIEPVFDFKYQRALTLADGTTHNEIVEDYALTLFRNMEGPDADLPNTFKRTADLTPDQHLKMQAAIQPHVDSAISKTINCPEDLPFEHFKDIYANAYKLGLKGCTTYRPNAVTGAVLKSLDPEPEHAIPKAPKADTARPMRLPHSDGSSVVYIAKTIERSPELHGLTYKLKWPESDHAIYVTINDIEHDGRRRPFEIFINTRNLEHYAWTVALTRMISAVFRRGGDVSFVADELKAVFDPQGGCWINGRYVPSLLAAIGEIIETHMRKTGFMPASDGSESSNPQRQRNIAEVSGQIIAPDPQGLQDLQGSPDPQGSMESQVPQARAASPAPTHNTGRPSRARLCPRCSSSHLTRLEACWVCNQCGYSRCD